MVEEADLNPFTSGADPKQLEGELVFPHHLPRHLKQGAKAIEKGRRAVIYAFDNGKPWYMLEAYPLGKSWSRPGDGQFLGSTSREIKDYYGCRSDMGCIRKLLADHQIPLIPHPHVVGQEEVRVFNLLLEPEFTRF